MKITRYAMMLAAATGLLSACRKLDEVKAYDPDKVVAPVLHALPGEIVITPDNMGSTQTFTWDAADFGVRLQHQNLAPALRQQAGADEAVVAAADDDSVPSRAVK